MLAIVLSFLGSVASDISQQTVQHLVAAVDRVVRWQAGWWEVERWWSEGRRMGRWASDGKLLIMLCIGKQSKEW